MRDYRPQECVLCLLWLFPHLWRYCNPITLHLKPIIHPYLATAITHTHSHHALTRSQRLDSEKPQICKKGKKEMEKRKKMCFFTGLGWLPSAKTSWLRVWVNNREWRTHQSPTRMKSSQFIHGINEPSSPTQVATTRMDGGERERCQTLSVCALNRRARRIIDCLEFECEMFC